MNRGTCEQKNSKNSFACSRRGQRGGNVNKGSSRVTVRIGDEMREAIEEAVKDLNARAGATREWTITEFIVQAVVEKLSHRDRSKGLRIKTTSEKVDDNLPREFEQNEY